MQKRFMLTLDEEPYREMQEVAKSMGMPRSTVSHVCNEAIKNSVEMWKKVQKSGRFTISDLFTQMAQLTMEEVNAKPAQKAKTVEKRVKRKV